MLISITSTNSFFLEREREVPDSLGSTSNKGRHSLKRPSLAVAVATKLCLFHFLLLNSPFSLIITHNLSLYIFTYTSQNAYTKCIYVIRHCCHHLTYCFFLGLSHHPTYQLSNNVSLKM